MLTSRLTVCLFAFNEERRIRQGIANFDGLCRLLVIDNFSTDATAEIARGLGVEVVQVRNPGYIETPEVMDRVQAAVSTPYLLIASCAEVVPAPLLQLYAAEAERGEHDVVRALRISITAGRAIPISGSVETLAHDLRMFRKGTVDYDGNRVHHVGRVTVPEERVLRLGRAEPQHYFYHYRDYDCSRTEDALRRYDDVLAQQRFASGERFSVFRAIYRSLGVFGLAYVRFGCYRHGMLGFLHASYRGIMEFTLQLRLWELQSGSTLDWVIAQNTREKNARLAEIDALRRSLGVRPVGASAEEPAPLSST